MEIPESNPVGYQWLAERFDVVTMPHWTETRILKNGVSVQILTEFVGQSLDFKISGVARTGPDSQALLPGY